VARIDGKPSLSLRIFLYGVHYNKSQSEDIDVILQNGRGAVRCGRLRCDGSLSLPWASMRSSRSILWHLHFWCEGFTGRDERYFGDSSNTCVRRTRAPRGLKEGARKGIVRIKL